MREVAEAFGALEATTKRLEKAEILAGILRRAAPAEVDRIIYLSQGMLGPPFSQPEFLVSEHLIPQAIALASGLPEPEVVARYKRQGDLGLVVEGLLAGPGEGLSVGEAYDALYAMATLTGAGVQTRKLEALAALLRRLSGLEARYVVRVVQGRLRLGMADATLMDAISQAAVGDRSLRPLVERAYSFSSDLGLVARTLLTSGPDALARFRPTPGRPVRPALAERLPSPEEVARKLGRVIAEPKYDGLRLQIQKGDGRVWLFTRRLEDVTRAFPEIARAAQRQIRAERAIVDGEAVVYQPETGEYLPFQVTARRRRKYEIEAMLARYPLRVFVFDLLLVDDEDYTPRPLRERQRRLREILHVEAEDPIQLTPGIETDRPAELERFFQEMVQRGLEGVLVKRPDAPYHAGARKHNWVKLKRAYRAELRETVDVVLVGYLVGRGKRARFGIGSLLGAVYDPENGRFRTVTKIGSGLTEEEWMEMRRLLDAIRLPEKAAEVDSLLKPDVWVQPRYVVEVQADEITRSPMHTCGKVGKQPGYALRFPRLIGWIRLDKRPEDATTEQEILDLYRMQGPRPQPGRRAA